MYVFVRKKYAALTYKVTDSLTESPPTAYRRSPHREEHGKREQQALTALKSTCTCGPASRWLDHSNSTVLVAAVGLLTETCGLQVPQPGPDGPKPSYGLI